MKRIVLTALVISLLFSLASVTAYANPLPTPVLEIWVSNHPTGTYYLDILDNESTNNIKFEYFNTKYPESYKELPLYKYYEDGWLAAHIRKPSLWGELKYNTSTTHRFIDSSYGSMPKTFKVIMQYESGELYVSKSEYSFNSVGQITRIDFQTDMQKVGEGPSIKHGDVNGDGVVDSTDYVLVKRYILGITKEFPSPNGLTAGDVNGSGGIDSLDYTLMKRYLLKMIIKFPVEELNL
ncbi:MAG: dockerin type I repeat-containing protein [Bacillota bacterium]